MSEDRNPFWVQCPSCEHRWIAAYMPLPAETFAKLSKSAACPMCGTSEGVTITSGGHAPPEPGHIDDVSKRLIAWFGSSDTGISSKAIATHMSGGTAARWGWGHPHDPDDLGRCLRLLRAIPRMEAAHGRDGDAKSSVGSPRPALE